MCVNREGKRSGRRCVTDLQQCVPHKTKEEVPSPPTDGPGGILCLVDGGKVKDSNIWLAIVIFLGRI